jgi:hypothetical protein
VGNPEYLKQLFRTARKAIITWHGSQRKAIGDVAGGGYYNVSWDRAINRKDWRHTTSQETTRFSERPAHHVNTDGSAESIIVNILISATTTCLLAVQTIND